MKLFDQLIANIDRNQGNLLYDADWHLFLIDHSRAFTTRTSLDGIAVPATVDARAVAAHRGAHRRPTRARARRLAE